MDRQTFGRGAATPDQAVKIGGKTLSTPVVKNKSNPVWDENAKFFSFTLQPDDDAIAMEVYDHDPLTNDDLIVRVVLNISEIYAGEWTERRERLDVGNGNLKFKISWTDIE